MSLRPSQGERFRNFLHCAVLATSSGCRRSASSRCIVGEVSESRGNLCTPAETSGRDFPLALSAIISAGTAAYYRAARCALRLLAIPCSLQYLAQAGAALLA